MNTRIEKNEMRTRLRRPGSDWLVILILGVIALGSGARADEARFETRRALNNDATSDIIIEWEGTAPGQSFDIYASDRAEAGPGEAIAIARDISAKMGKWQTNSFDRVRPYFIVTDATTDKVIAKTAVRLLPLEGGRNFRDIGGYRSADGRITKWGQVFRSGRMSALSQGDYELLSTMNIRVVCDFRSVAERDVEPTNWQAGPVRYFAWDDVEDVSASVVDMFTATDGKSAGQMLALAYPDYLIEHGEKYKKVLDSILADELPLAFNCSAGKDRAGMATALVLSVLGVPRETIVHDYSLSDDYVDYMKEFTGQSSGIESPRHYLAQLPEAELRSLMASDPVYMEMALDEVERRYGSLLAFAMNEMGLTDKDVETLRGRLLESY